MSERYPIQRLRDLMRLDVRRERIVEGTTYRLAGVLNAGQGVVDKGEFDGSGTEYATMNVLREGQVVMRKLTAWEGPIAVVPAEFDGFVVSGEFPTFTLGEGVAPAWFGLVCQSPRLWAEMKSRVVGTVQRRKRLNPGHLLEIEFPVPPLPVQERIVELIAAVDAQATALDTEAAAVDSVAGAIAESLLTEHELIPVGRHLVRTEAGRSPMARNQTPLINESGVLKVSAVTAFRFVPSESKALLAETVLPESLKVRAGDVLMTRASGSIDRVGAVCRVPNYVRDRLYLSDKTIRLVPEATLDADYLVVAMSLGSARRQIESAASGSASMKNISQMKVAQIEIPVPGLDEQRRVVAAVMALRRSADANGAEAERLRALRSSLLASLLNCEIEIKTAEELVA